jgi:hypothetical protein
LANGPAEPLLLGGREGVRIRHSADVLTAKVARQTAISEGWSLQSMRRRHFSNDGDQSWMEGFQEFISFDTSVLFPDATQRLPSVYSRRVNPHFREEKCSLF